MAPLLIAIAKMLATQGLSLAANAVLVKGKEFVEEKTGLDLGQPLTVEGLTKVKQFELEHEEFLVNMRHEDNKLDAEVYKAELADTQSARDMNAAVQQSDTASWLAKNLPYILDLAIVVGALLLGLLLFVLEIPTGNRELALTAFGLLLGLASTVVNFHRGTSRGSKDKDSLLAALAKRI